MLETERFNPAELQRGRESKVSTSRRVEALNAARAEKKGETMAERQHQEVAGLLELFVHSAKTEGKFDSLQSARDAFKFIQDRALGQSFSDKVALEGPDVQATGAIITGQEIKITAQDENTGRTLNAEFTLNVVADKDSKNYGKYKLVPLNEDARRLT